VLYAILLAQVAATVGLHEVVRARLHAAASGAKGGSKKAIKQIVPRRKALQFVAYEWRKWKKNHRPEFDIFWDLESSRIYNKLKRIDKNAADTICRDKRGMNFVTAKVMKGNIRKFETQSLPVQAEI
jgi:hypothetical protein